MWDKVDLFGDKFSGDGDRFGRLLNDGNMFDDILFNNDVLNLEVFDDDVLNGDLIGGVFGYEKVSSSGFASCEVGNMFFTNFAKN